MIGKPVPRVLALALALAAVAPISAAADPQPSVFAGATFGSDQMAYLGVTWPFPSSRPDQDFAVRAIASGSKYTYTSEPLGKIEGKEARLDVSALYQATAPDGYFDAGLGARLVHTDLSPSDPFNSREGDIVELSASLSGQQGFGPWRVAGYGSYGFHIRDYYVRGELTREISPRWRLGAEALAEGDRTYDRQHYGALVSYRAGSDWEIQLSGGAREQRSHSGAYAAIGFRRSF